LIAGLTCNSTTWWRNISVFSQEYRVIAIDNRGSGRSDKPDIPYSMEMMAADIAGLLNTINVDAAHIFGVSLGGDIAQHFALHYPERVISLVLGCTSCGGGHAIRSSAETRSSFRAMFNQEYQAEMQKLSLEEQAKKVFPLFFTQKFIDGNPTIMGQHQSISWQYMDPLYSLARQGQASAAHDTYERLPQIKAPTLVIAGDADRGVPVENSRLLVSRIPNAELVILKNVGHAFYVEAAEEANRVILDFLRQHPRSS